MCCIEASTFLTLLGLFGATIVIWRPGNCAPIPPEHLTPSTGTAQHSIESLRGSTTLLKPWNSLLSSQLYH